MLVGVASVAKKYHVAGSGLPEVWTQDVGVVHQYGIDAVFSVLTQYRFTGRGVP